jgi:uncharacterized protein (UPF0548 family)
MFLWTRPSDTEVKSFLDRQTHAALTYSTGQVSASTPKGFNVDSERFRIGTGRKLFSAATVALESWRMFEIGWLQLYPERPTVIEGTNVAMLVRHFGFWSLNGCRVVERMSATDSRFGFAYGTLDDHAESGQEWFSVELDPADESVWYAIKAVSRPSALLAKLGSPLARRLQRKFRRESAIAMRSALASG